MTGVSHNHRDVTCNPSGSKSVVLGFRVMYQGFSGLLKFEVPIGDRPSFHSF